MADKPHPLDIFRSSDQGFDGASRRPRKRRTVSGKVVRSVARSDPKARRAGASATASAARASPSGGSSSRGTGRRLGRHASAKTTAPTRTPRARAGAPSRLGSTRVLALTAGGVVVLLAMWLWFGRDGGDVPLSKPAVIGAAAGSEASPGTAGSSPKSATDPVAKTNAPVPRTTEPAARTSQPAGRTTEPASLAPAAPPVYSVLAATYAGSAAALAADTVRALRERGFDDVGLLGWSDGAKGYDKVELYVGRARSAESLERTLKAIQAIDDWGSGRERRPFHDARVVAHPHPVATDGG